MNRQHSRTHNGLHNGPPATQYLTHPLPRVDTTVLGYFLVQEDSLSKTIRTGRPFDSEYFVGCLELKLNRVVRLEMAGLGGLVWAGRVIKKDIINWGNIHDSYNVNRVGMF